MLRRWLHISIFNLVLVALAGVIMRYKIVYPLPLVNQKYLLHAHSHFAFAGWITQALMSLLVWRLSLQNDQEKIFRRYRLVLIANLITAYGMFLSFLFQGYGFISIIFSTLSIFASYWFAIQYWIDLNRQKEKTISRQWFKAALLFNAISSIGAFSLAAMMAAHSVNTERYLASVYFFLHFQYNGWFFFGCMGLFAELLFHWGIRAEQLRKVYWLFVSACMPAYLLSVLWMHLPLWLYVIVLIAVLFQLAGWIIMLKQIRLVYKQMKKAITPLPLVLLMLCGLALSVKLGLQSGSVFPSLSKLAFGFRPIVIGYLHLVLLAVITLFIISYILALKLIPVKKLSRIGAITATIGIILNEVLLMIQGIADIRYFPVPFINNLLLVAAIILFSGFLMLVLSFNYIKIKID